MEESPFARLLLANTKAAPFWLIIRLYLGWEWLTAGWAKVMNPVWFGNSAGGALTGFVNGALQKTSGAHPDVQWWYAWFLQHAVLPHTNVWSNLVAGGELLVGIALLLGFLTGISAFFGMFMNLNYLLAGTVSINPIWFTLSIGLILAWKVSGYVGLDRFVLPRLHSYFRPKKLISS